MRQINFSLIFGFGLAMVFFTLENTAATTVHLLPGLQYTLPLAALLLVAAGIGAISAWFFASWSGMLNNLEQFSREGELEAQQVRIKDLENDLNRYRATVQTQLGLLPSASSSDANSETNTDHVDVQTS